MLQRVSQGQYEIADAESGMLIRGLPIFFYSKSGARLWSVRSVKDWKTAAKLFLEELVEKYGEARVNDAILSLIESCADLETFVESAVYSDGRGHFLSHYNGGEIEVNGFFIYRTN